MDPVPGAPCGFTLLFIVESGQAQRLRRSYDRFTVRRGLRELASPILARLRCYERDTCGRLGQVRFSSSMVKPYVSARRSPFAVGPSSLEHSSAETLSNARLATSRRNPAKSLPLQLKEALQL